MDAVDSSFHNPANIEIAVERIDIKVFVVQIGFVLVVLLL